MSERVRVINGADHFYGQEGVAKFAETTDSSIIWVRLDGELYDIPFYATSLEFFEGEDEP